MSETINLLERKMMNPTTEESQQEGEENISNNTKVDAPIKVKDEKV